MSDYPGYARQPSFQGYPTYPQQQQPTYSPYPPQQQPQQQYQQQQQAYPNYPPSQPYQPTTPVYGLPQPYPSPSPYQPSPSPYQPSPSPYQPSPSPYQPSLSPYPSTYPSYSPSPSPYQPTTYASAPSSYYLSSYSPNPHPIAVQVTATTSSYPVVATAAPVMAAYPAMNYVLQFKGLRLDRHDVFSKSDPFVVLMASRHPGGYLTHRQAKRERRETRRNKRFGIGNGNWVMIHRSETVMNNQNPLWNPFVVNLYSLCGGNFDAPFKIEVWDFDSHSNHDFIGSSVVTMRDLSVLKEVRLTNKRRVHLYGSCSGTLEVLRCAPQQ